MMVDTLNKYRGKGQQKMTVEHVHVHAGGQAIVGSIEQTGGGSEKTEEQPHAQQITYAIEPTLWSADASQDAVPVPSDDKWSVPNAWWEISGSTEK